MNVQGLGYVGLPVAVAFARQGTPVTGFDIDAGRIAELKAGHDRTREVDTHDRGVADVRPDQPLRLGNTIRRDRCLQRHGRALRWIDFHLGN